MRPFTRIPGSVRISSTHSSNASGRTPPMLSTRPMFTSTSTSMVVLSRWQRREISFANFTLPTDWMQLTLPIRYFTLLVCSWPINWISHRSLCRPSYLSKSSWTRFSPMQASPFSMAWLTTSRGTVLVAASNVISWALRPDFSAARAISSKLRG